MFASVSLKAQSTGVTKETFPLSLEIAKYKLSTVDP